LARCLVKSWFTCRSTHVTTSAMRSGTSRPPPASAARLAASAAHRVQYTWLLRNLASRSAFRLSCQAYCEGGLCSDRDTTCGPCVVLSKARAHVLGANAFKSLIPATLLLGASRSARALLYGKRSSAIGPFYPIFQRAGVAERRRTHSPLVRHVASMLHGAARTR
jgi:hypothetical protein